MQTGGAGRRRQRRSSRTTPPQVQFPDPDLAKAVFARRARHGDRPGQGRAGLVRGEGDQIVAGRRDDVRPGEGRAARDRVIAGKAADLIYDRANKIDNVLGNGSALDDLPGDLGLVGVAGTLDADGNTAEGTAGADPRPGGTARRHRQGRVRRPTGRSAAADRGADAVDRRLGLLRADGGERHSRRR